MAVVSVKERATGRRGALNLDGSARYLRLFTVETNSFDDAAATIAAHPAIPAIGSPYATSSEIDAGAFVEKVTPRQLAAFDVWDVEIEYRRELGESEDPAQSDPNPLNRPAVLEWGFRARQKVLTSATRVDFPATLVDDQPITNSAGTPFEPPPTYTDFMLTLRVTRNSPLPLRVGLADAVVNYTNSDVFLGFEAGQVRIEGYDAEKKFGGPADDQFYYQTATWRFEFDPDGFDWLFLDRSLLEWSGSYAIQLAEDGDGARASAPVLLDGEGFKLPPGGTPRFRRYRPQVTAGGRPFANLPIFAG